jgi:hypothetical protein
MTDVKPARCPLERLRRKETQTSTRTNSKPSELERLILGYEPATLHEKKMPINIGRSAFSE